VKDVNQDRAGAWPLEPPPTTVSFPAATDADDRGKVAVGGDLDPGTLLAAYRSGLFPMRQPDGDLAWWSPDPRGVLFVDRLQVSRSLRRSLRRFDISVDTSFQRVIEACADRGADDYQWITAEIRDAFTELHRLGWAHSVEAWTRAGDGSGRALVGGLYGVAIGGLFSGESMFHHERDASKAALVALVDLLRAGREQAAGRMVDVQWLTPHLESLGGVAIPRAEYLMRLERALGEPLPPAFAA
jgi:leucyl/phenylalanyl-tRNA--protein transferase